MSDKNDAERHQDDIKVVRDSALNKGPGEDRTLIPGTDGVLRPMTRNEYTNGIYAAVTTILQSAGPEGIERGKILETVRIQLAEEGINRPTDAQIDRQIRNVGSKKYDTQGCAIFGVWIFKDYEKKATQHN